MASENPISARRALRAWARAADTPAWPVAALIVVKAAAAAGVAAGLAELLTAAPRNATGLAASGLATTALALAVSAAAAAGETWLSARRARQSVRAVRARLVAAVLLRRRGQGGGLGESLAAAVDEVEALDGYFARYAPAALEARLAPLLIAAAAAVASPVSAAILLATLVPFVAVMAVAGGAAATQSRLQLEALAHLSGRFVDAVRALPVVLAFQAQAAEASKVARAADQTAQRTLAVLRVAFVSSAALEFFAALAVALVAVYCGFGLLGLLPFRPPERLEFQHAFYALALAPEFYAPLRRLAGAYHERQLGEAAAQRLAALAGDAAPEAVAQDPAPAFADPPAIVVQDLVLAFGDHVVVGPLRAEFPAGRVAALVGPTGSGKSALLAALVGLAPASGGGGRIGERPIGANLAAETAWVGQAPVFLPGTVLDNLMAADPGVTAAQALAMAETVGLGPALASRPEGAQTPVDERGSGFSGGERRRLAIARALLKPARLLVLDEPTADLDSAAEADVLRLIRQAAGQRTVLLATHSETLAAAADTVLRLA